MGQKVLNKRSVQVVNNGPKLPTPEQLEYGELAINYADGHETLAIKNNQNEIVPFSSDEKIYDNVQIQIDNALVPVLSAITDITSAITDDEFVVATALADLDDRITTINNYSEGLNTLINELSGSVMDNYALSAVTHQEIEDAKGDILVFVNNLSGSVSAFSASVVNTYATSAKTHSAIAAASGNVYKSATAYTKTVSGNIELNFKKYATSAQTHGAITALGTRIDNANTAINGLSGSVSAFSASVVSLEDDLIDRIESALTKVYKFKGSKDNYSDLSTISNPSNGDVYNVVNAKGNIGEEGYIPPGTNYAWNETGNTWDALGGSIDLSNYVTQDQLSAATATTDNVMRAVYYVSGAVSAFSASVISKYATSANTHSAIAAASGNVYNTATAYTKTVSGNIEKNFGKYATSANTHNTFTAVGTRIDNLSSDLNTLSGAVSAFNASMIVQFATKAEASEYAAVAYSNSVNYTDSVSGNIEQNFKKYATSAQTHGAVTALGTRIDNVNTTINGLSGSVSAFSASVISKYATSANTHSAIAAASGNVYNTATAYTKTVSGNIEKNFGKYATSANTHNTFTAVGTRIDNLSSDLNALSGAVSAFNASIIGDFATKAEASEYAAAALANAMDYTDSVSGNIEQNFGKYATSAQTHGAVTALGTRIDNVNTTINGLSGSVSAFSASVISTYATSSNTHSAIAAASGNVYKSATAYTKQVSGYIESNFGKYATSANTHAKIESVKSELNNRIDGVSTDVSNLSGSVIAFSGVVRNNYATKAEASQYAAAAYANAMNYTDSVSGNIEQNFKKYPTSAQTHGAITALGTRIDNVNTTINGLSGSVSAFSASVVSLEGDLIDRIESALTIVYKYKGTVTSISQLLSITNASNGDVYNLTVASGDTPPGTNYAWNETGNTWDALGGSVDLSNYVTQDQLSAATATTDNVMRAVYYVSGAVSAFSASVISKYATSANTHSAIATASGNVYNTATAYTKTVSGNIEKNFGKYATSANTHSTFTAVGTRIDNLSSDLNALSGAVSAFNATMIGDFATKAEASEYAAAALANSVSYTDSVSGNIELNFKKYATSAQTHGAITSLGTRIDNVNTAINGLSGSVSAFSASVISKYATSANTHNAIAAASGNVYNTATAYTKTVSGNIEKNFGKYATSANTHNTFTAVGTRIDNLSSDLNALSGAVSAFNASMVGDFATKAEAAEYASSALINAIDYIDEASGYIRTTLTGSYATSAQTHGAITAIGTRVDNISTSINGLSGSVSAFSASVISKYATSANTHSAIAAASGNVYNTATAYTKTVSGNIEKNFGKYATSANTHSTFTAVGTRIDNLSSDLNALSGAVSAFNASMVGDFATKAEASEYASMALSNAIDYVNEASGYIRTTLTGSYATSAQTHGAITALGTRVDNANTAINGLSGSVSAFSASVISKYATSANTHSAIAAASGNVYNTATAYTKTVSGNIEQNFKKYATSAQTHGAVTALGTRIDNANTAINGLSGSVSAFSAYVAYNYATKAEASEYASTAYSNATDYTDVASGYIRTTLTGSYVTSAITHTAIKAVDTRVDGAIREIGYVSGGLYTFSASVVSKYATSANTHNAIAAASGNVYKSATAYTNTVSGNIEQNFKKYATSADTHNAISSTNTRIDNLTQEIIDNEFVTAHALNDLNDRLEDLFLNVVDLSTFADYFSFQQITEEDNGKILQVVNGKLTLVMPT